jgi:hypothetical protein
MGALQVIGEADVARFQQELEQEASMQTGATAGWQAPLPAGDQKDLESVFFASVPEDASTQPQPSRPVQPMPSQRPQRQLRRSNPFDDMFAGEQLGQLVQTRHSD